MKKIQRELTTYKAIYVSVDGKEFDNEADCRAWENSYKGTLSASWNLIKKVDADSVNLCLPYASEDYECYVIKPMSLDDITLINAYIQSSTNNNCTVLNASYIGKLTALNFGYDHDYCEAYALEDHIDSLAKHISDLENEFNPEENTTN